MCIRRYVTASAIISSFDPPLLQQEACITINASTKGATGNILYCQPIEYT